MYRIKPEELARICEAARLGFKKMNEINHNFPVEEKKATELLNRIRSVNWDKYAELIITEMPF